ncbi:MAG: COP23 domain-containing protein [Pseudanabaena sp. ELA607]|jgi:hypothetical protein
MQNLATFGKYSLGIVASLGLATASLIFSHINPASAQSSGEEIDNIDASFLCKKVNNQWATIVNSSSRQGEDVPFIIWSSNSLAKAGYNNQKRCQMVSSRLNELFHNGQLEYLTTGTINGQPVICGTRSNSETCAKHTIVLTLKNRAQSTSIIKHLFDLKRGVAVGPITQARPEDQEPIPSHLSLKDIIRNAPSP